MLWIRSYSVMQEKFPFRIFSCSEFSVYYKAECLPVYFQQISTGMTLLGEECSWHWTVMIQTKATDVARNAEIIEVEHTFSIFKSEQLKPKCVGV